MKKIVPANPGIIIRSCGCMGDDSPSGMYCDHSETFDQTVIAWIVYTEEDAIQKEADGFIYVEPVTTLDAMENIQKTGGFKSRILINGFDADLMLKNGVVQK